jgi:anti-anti-sigma regulatory factor
MRLTRYLLTRFRESYPMPVSSKLQADGYTVEISPQNKSFDYQIWDEFMAQLEQYAKGKFNFVVDFRVVEHIDSSGIGLLIKLREHCLPYKTISCTHLSDPVFQRLKASSFDKLFALSCASK